jgi:hypothetical protein
VNAAPGVPEEPQPHAGSRHPEARLAGFEVADALRPAIARTVERAGPGLEALILAGSHASGEAVWTTLEGRSVSLSDVDLYAVMRSDAAVTAARARADAVVGARERHASGLLAPVEVAFVTFAGLARMPARPGTVELARSGRVVVGEPGLLARLPRWQASAIDAEERLLLLENRAFELLWADAAWTGGGPLAGAAPAGPLAGGPLAATRLRARHAVLKTALELAAARTLAHGELPAGAEARVARAMALGAPAGHPLAGPPSWLAGAWEGLEPVWREGLAWRAGDVRVVSDAVQTASWRAVTRAWCVAWWAETGAGATDPWERALAVAARGSLARRLRRSLAPVPGRGAEPGPLDRLRHAVAGTPQHRIHGSAAVLMLAAAQGPGEPRLPAGALRALHALGVTRADHFHAAARETFVAWDRQLHTGERAAEIA